MVATLGAARAAMPPARGATLAAKAGEQEKPYQQQQLQTKQQSQHWQQLHQHQSYYQQELLRQQLGEVFLIGQVLFSLSFQVPSNYEDAAVRLDMFRSHRCSFFCHFRSL
jgi:hypothetical protein